MAGQNNEIIVQYKAYQNLFDVSLLHFAEANENGAVEYWRIGKMRKNRNYFATIPILHGIISTHIITIASIFFLSIFRIVPAEENADFIIVGNPHVYSILDKYEQPLSESDKDLFLPFSPLQIVSGDATLGDEITRASKFRFNRSSYYLLLDDDGNYAGDLKNRYRQVFKNCQIIEDTIHITKNRAILLAQKYPARGKRTYLEKGCRVIRLFKYRSYYYIKCTGMREAYGWCSLASKNGWQKVKSIIRKQETSLNNTIPGRIASRIESVNKIYNQYFEHFNRISKQQKSIPQWRYTIDSDVIHCTLSEPYYNSEQLRESTYYLVQDIENMLLGRPYRVQYQPGEITVKRRE